MKQQDNANSLKDIIELIEQMIYKGGRSNFAIIHLKEDYYMQMAAGKGDYEIYCEAVSNYYLEEKTCLNESQQKTLENLNWKLNGNEGNFSMTFSVDSENARKTLAELLLRTAKEVYNIDRLAFGDFSIHLE